MKKSFFHFLIFFLTLVCISQSFGQGSSNSLPTQGNVGVGTNNPSNKLHVVGKVRIDSSMVINDSLRVKGELKVGSNSLIIREASGFSEIYTTSSGEELQIQSQGSNNNTIINSNTGKVGIGTDSPAEKLHVAGNTQITGNLKIGNDLIFTEPPFPLSIDPCDTLLPIGIGPNGNVVAFEAPAAMIDTCDTIICNTPTTPLIPYWQISGNIVNDDHRFIGTRSNHDFNLKTANKLRFKIKKSGEMIIGSNVASQQPPIPLQISTFRPIFFAPTGGQGVYGEYIGFNCYLNTTVTPNQLIKSANPSSASQPGCAALITDYTGNLFIQTWNSGQNTNSASTNLNPQFKFKSDGVFYAKEAVVMLPPFPDYVFQPNYDLISIMNLKKYIEINKRLPGLPTAEQIEQEGIGLGKLQVLMLEKIEEQALYIIELNDKVTELQRSLEELKN